MNCHSGFELNDLDQDLLDLVRHGYRILQVNRNPQQGLHYSVPRGEVKWAVPTVAKIVQPGDGSPPRAIEHVLICKCPVAADADKPTHKCHRLHVVYANGVRGEACLKDFRDDVKMFGWLGVIDDGEDQYFPKLPLPQVIAEVSANPVSHLSF